MPMIARYRDLITLPKHELTDVVDRGRVQLGLILPEDALDSSRHGYLADVDRLVTYVTGHYDSAWFIDHLQGHLQFLSAGRFVLGIGAGGQEAEHLAYGYAFPPGRQRVAALDEALHIITTLWKQGRATFTGEHHRVEDAWCEPKPEPPPPIMVGAFKPTMLRLAARHADWWNVSSTGIAAYREYHPEFERACEEIGRDPATVRRTWSGGCVCAPTAAQIADLAATRLRRGADQAHQAGEDFIGTPPRSSTRCARSSSWASTTSCSTAAAFPA
jgi:alkanesulfonate monooxygenase SsuD/methylene tetrahydromethanopterin reductase-like flavin-dependent oxidoreductase (luciferase family)